MSILEIPTVDLSPFWNNADEIGKKKAIEIISEACSELGFFQIINHGVCLNLMNRALKISKEFFESPIEEKLKISPRTDSQSPSPAGYNRKPKPEYEFSEFFMMFPPGSNFNIFPNNQPHLRFTYYPYFYFYFYFIIYIFYNLLQFNTFQESRTLFCKFMGIKLLQRSDGRIVPGVVENIICN